jgi:hypothetical protein
VRIKNLVAVDFQYAINFNIENKDAIILELRVLIEDLITENLIAMLPSFEPSQNFAD